MFVDPWPDHRERRRVLNHKVSEPDGAEFIMYVMDDDHYFGVLYDVDQQEHVITVRTVFQGFTLL